MLACSPHIICVSGHRWSSGTRLIDAKDDFKPNNARKKPIKKKNFKGKMSVLNYNHNHKPNNARKKAK